MSLLHSTHSFESSSPRALRLRWVDAKLDSSNVAEFRTCIDRLWTDEVESIELNMAAVGFIDSSGIGALLSLRTRKTGESIPVTLVNARRAVIEVIELLRLQSVFSLRQEADPGRDSASL